MPSKCGNPLTKPCAFPDSAYYIGMRQRADDALRTAKMFCLRKSIGAQMENSDSWAAFWEKAMDCFSWMRKVTR